MALVNFIRQGTTTAAQTINFSVGGTATLNTDYTVTFPVGVTGTWSASSGSVTIPIGSGQVDVNLAVIQDSIREEDETIIITIASVSPSVAISSSNNVAIFIIRNDDFLVHAKFLGISINGTLLVGTLVNSVNFSSVNTGTAPANWNDWVVNNPGQAGFVSASLANTPRFYPCLTKIVFRTPPLTSPGDVLYQINQLYVSVTLTVGSFKMTYGDNQVATYLGDVFTGLTPDTWYDLIVEQKLSNTTFYLNGVLSFTIPNAFTLTFNDLLIFNRGEAATAVVSMESGRKYNATMFPITPANL